MAEPVTLQTLLTYLTLISVPVGVIYHIMTLRNQSRTRQAQLFMGVYNQLGDPLLIEAWTYYREQEKITQELMDEALNPDNPDRARNRARMTRLSLFFEGLGTLVREDLVPIRLVALMMQGMVRPYWEKMEDYVYESRSGYPSMGSEIEYLYKAMMKYIDDNPDFYKS